MENLQHHLDEIIQLSESMLQEPPVTFTDDQREFTEVILRNAQRFNTMLPPVLEALPSHVAGDPFPGDMHDMRTPLVSIIGYSDAFCSGVMGEISGEYREAYAAILEHGLQLRDRLETIYATIKAQLSDNTLIG